MPHCAIGLNGERVDPLSYNTHLGNGYRTYNPVLMRFDCCDNWSPFGAGGINAYIWCAGDPVNRTDPSGHLSWQAGVGIGLGVLGIVGAAFTVGTSLAAAGSLSAALATTSVGNLIIDTCSLVADVAGIAAAALENENSCLASALGWVAMTAGIMSAGTGLAGFAGKADRALGGLLQNNSRFLRKLRSQGQAVGIPMSGEFRNARLIGRNTGSGPFAWNFSFVDTVPAGSRLTIIMGSKMHDLDLHILNRQWHNNEWGAEMKCGPALIRDMAGSDTCAVYRLGITNSGICVGGDGCLRSFGQRLLERLPARSGRIVMSYVGDPEPGGIVAEKLGGLSRLANDLNSAGPRLFDLSPGVVQSALNELSDRYAYEAGAFTLNGTVRIYPKNSYKTYTDIYSW